MPTRHPDTAAASAKAAVIHGASVALGSSSACGAAESASRADATTPGNARASATAPTPAGRDKVATPVSSSARSGVEPLSRTGRDSSVGARTASGSTMLLTPRPCRSPYVAGAS